MKIISRWGIGFLVIILLVLPTGVTAQTTTFSESAYRTELLKIIASLQQQIVVLKALLAEKEQHTIVSEGDTTSPLRETVSILATYPIAVTANTELIPNRTHRVYFNRVFALFPDQYDARIGQAIVFAESESEIDAFVETMPPRHTKWIYAVSEGVIDEPLAAWNTELIVHELAHLIAYEKILNSDVADVSCEPYFLRHGCPPADSYLRAYVAQFWDSSDLKRADRFAGDQAMAYDYHDDHAHEYVSEYAALSPEEDFAESFMYFVLEKPTSGSLAKKKVAFFEEYMTMLEIKQEVTESL
ncbi:MAG: hypothetical protein RL097_200 [Candidatus Parcubacteria bacterium]